MNSELIYYVRKRLHAGANEFQVRRELNKVGWEDREIDDALKYVPGVTLRKKTLPRGRHARNVNYVRAEYRPIQYSAERKLEVEIFFIIFMFLIVVVGAMYIFWEQIISTPMKFFNF